MLPSRMMTIRSAMVMASIWSWVTKIDGGAELLVEALDLGPHLHCASCGVEVGERLVEQEHLRLADDGAAHGDALALAADSCACGGRDSR